MEKYLYVQKLLPRGSIELGYANGLIFHQEQGRKDMMKQVHTFSDTEH